MKFSQIVYVETENLHKNHSWMKESRLNWKDPKCSFIRSWRLTKQVLFVFIFSFARMIAGPYITYVTWTADNPIRYSSHLFHIIVTYILSAETLFTFLSLVTECSCSLDSQMMAMGLQLVSIFWFYKIVRMVRHILAKWMNPNKIAKTSKEWSLTSIDGLELLLVELIIYN